MLSRLELSLSPMCEHSGGCEGSLHRPQAANTAARLAGKLGSTARELRGGRSIPRRGTRVALGRSPLARVRSEGGAWIVDLPRFGGAAAESWTYAGGALSQRP